MNVISVYSMEYDCNRLPYLRKERDTVFSEEFLVNTPKCAYEVFNQVFFPGNKAEEYIYMIACDVAGHVKGMFVVSHGGVTGTILNVQGIFARALLCNASCIIIAHNHPSGVCNISKEDEAWCRKLAVACDIMGITLSDFLILGNCSYKSFKENGML